MHRIVIGVALGVVVMIGGCGDPIDDSPGAATSGWSTPGCDFARVPPRMTVGGVSTPTTPPSLQTVMSRIDNGGRADFPHSFAGLEVDQDRVRAIVYRVPAADFDDFIRASAGTACVVVRDAAHSARDLTVWHDRVLADLPYWSHRGIRIVSVGARHDGAGVEIGTTDAEQAREELLARYGTGVPLVFVAQAPVRQLTPRTTSPHA